METQTINERIAHRLAELGISQAELARRCHVDRSAVNQWVKGTVANIRPDHLLCIADALGLELRWLISGRGQRLARQIPVDFDNGDLALVSAPKQIKQIFHQILDSSTPKAD